MRAHYIQHVPFEDPANISPWLKEKNISVTKTQLFRDETLPSMESFDFLIIMGGPMGIYDYKMNSWLKDEKKFIEESIINNKHVLGICLGAQLIADVLGAKVYKNDYTEIGWHPVSKTNVSKKSKLLDAFPSEFTPFHWHGDTFDLPAGAIKIAESTGCSNQAFIYNELVTGFQFHIESSVESIEKLIKNCSDEIVEGKYIQNGQEMMESADKKTGEVNKMLFEFLDKFVVQAGK